MFAHTNLPGYKWTNCLSQVGLPISLSLAGAIGICTSLCQLLKLKTYSLRNCGASTFHHGKCKLKLATQSSPTLCDPMDCSPPGPTVRGIFQARILKLVAMPFSRGTSLSRDRTQVSCIAGRFFMTSATWEAHLFYTQYQWYIHVNPNLPIHSTCLSSILNILSSTLLFTCSTNIS